MNNVLRLYYLFFSVIELHMTDKCESFKSSVLWFVRVLKNKNLINHVQII